MYDDLIALWTVAAQRAGAAGSLPASVIIELLLSTEDILEDIGTAPKSCGTLGEGAVNSM